MPKQTLIKTLTPDAGEIHATIDGRTILLAKCRAKISIYERYSEESLQSLDGAYKVRLPHLLSLHCSKTDVTRKVDAELLKEVSRLEFSGDVQRGDGNFERVRFDVVPEDIDPYTGEWFLRVDAPASVVQNLIKI